MVSKANSSKKSSKASVNNSTTKVAAKSSKSKKSKRVVKSNTVDYYPNRMTVAVSALAGTLLVLLALIAVLGSRL